ncbi:hypothetical protein SAMN05421505_112119 [Sinosporangium album]|uniref:Phage-related protein n=1 Tax=Sinosporangium album TaxID=504805 RepID=A0A1G8AED7_9ACTN|nr:hypothetical protein [Sinosporangium album]SDH19237.1 hypothetical protein SAMN05421505_112119 [Sinosporangium album]
MNSLLADGTKVGSGYIEIRPEIVGVTNALTRELNERLRGIAAGKIRVAPQITGITKRWQGEVQQVLNRAITGLTIKVKPVIDASKLQGAAARVSRTVAGESRRASEALTDDFSQAEDDIRRSMREIDISIRTGLKAASEADVSAGISRVEAEYKRLAEATEDLTNRQVGALRSGVREMSALQNSVSRTIESEARDVQRANELLESEIQRTISETDEMVERSRESMRRYSESLSSGWMGLGNSLSSISQQRKKISDSISSAFQDAEGIASRAGRNIGDSLSTAVGVTFRFGLARLFVNVPVILGAVALAAAPLAAAISTLAAGLTAVASQAAAAGGALLALPAVLGAVMQGTTVLSLAFAGIEDALSALQAEEDAAGRSSAALAQAMQAASERVEDAKRRVADVVESSRDRVAASETRLAEVVEESARRISDSEAALADAVAQAGDRIESARSRLVDAVEDSARLVEDAQARVTRAHEQSAERVLAAEDALRDSKARLIAAETELADAREAAQRRLENLALDIEGGILDEESARIALEKAKARFENFTSEDSWASELERRDAESAYEQARLRLREIELRNRRLREEQERANEEGIEGSREVTDAKQAILDAQESQIKAEKALAEARRESAADIAEAEKALARARDESARRISDSEAALADAYTDAARSIARAERDLQDARKQGSSDIAAAEKALADARSDGARQIEDAQRDLARAIRDSAQATAKQSEESARAEEALKKLSPAGREFVRFLDSTLLPRLQEVQWAIQDAFLPPLQAALAGSMGILGLIEDELAETAGIFGGFAGRVIVWLSTGESQNRIGRILDTNNRLFEKLGDSALSVLDSVLILTDTAGPLLLRLADAANEVLTRINEIISSGERSGRLVEFWDRVGDSIQRIVDIGVTVASTIAAVFEIAYPYGERLLKLVSDTFTEFQEWVNSIEGQNELREWFQRGEEVMRELWLLLIDVGKALFDIGREFDFAELIRVVREDILPAFLRFVAVLTGDGEGLAWALARVADLFVILEGAILAVKAVWQLITLDVEAFKKTLTELSEYFFSSFRHFFQKDFVVVLAEIVVQWQKTTQAMAIWWHGFVNAVKNGLVEIGKFYMETIKPFLDSLNPSALLQPFPFFRFADGGVVPGFQPGRDIVPALLSPGEGILRPEAVRFIGPDTVLALNAAAKRGLLKGFSDGGIAGYRAAALQAFRRQTQTAPRNQTVELGDRTGTVYNLTLNAAPTVPTERQMLNVLAYADALYG